MKGMFNALAIAFLCSILIAIDEIGLPQKMWIMNAVWPITALYFSILGLWACFRVGRKMTKTATSGGSAH